MRTFAIVASFALASAAVKKGGNTAVSAAPTYTHGAVASGGSSFGSSSCPVKCKSDGKTVQVFHSTNHGTGLSDTSVHSPANVIPHTCAHNQATNKCKCTCTAAAGQVEDKPACMCTKMYKPVTCGDGKTYGNSCEAKCEGQDDCADKPLDPAPCVCTKMYKPVTCGNGKTYGNSCEAKCEGQLGCADKVDPINSLFISEYVEGDSYRKAVELYNPTDSKIDLTDVQLVWHQNGKDKSGTAVYTIKSELKNKKINKGKTFVICRKETASNRKDVPNSKCDLQIDKDSKASMAVLHNGDDAITLEYGGKVIDIIGKVGEKKVWKDSKGVKMTQNKTIRRKKAISAGNPVWDAAEWNAYSKNQLNGLGNHNFKA